MNSAYPPIDVAQHMGMHPPSGYQQQQQQQQQPPPPPPMPHSMPPPGPGMDPYQQQHHPHPPPQNHQPHHYHQPHHPHPHMPLHPHAHHQHHQPSHPPQHPDGNEVPRHIPSEEHNRVEKKPPPPPRVISRAENGSNRIYRLDVRQQPERARMCGYGDKDRRPITPPPCVRLVITDAATGEEINCKDIDYSMFVLNVDLWNPECTEEVNLCRNTTSTGTPAISATPGYAYPPSNGGDSTSMRYAPSAMPPSRDMGYAQQPPPMNYVQDYQVSAPYAQAPPSFPPDGTYGPPQQYFPAHQGYRPEQSVATLPSQRYDPTVGYAESSGSAVSYVHDQYKGALNRNLIGSVAASAFCLYDTEGVEGIWFVLQDLSVRLEGKYLLRFSFVNVGYPGAGSRDRPSTAINKGRVPILASCFSQVFQVYSAKKFPGVWESTPLSKCFAAQGIKMPIRKDGGKGGDDDDAE